MFVFRPVARSEMIATPMGVIFRGSSTYGYTGTTFYTLSSSGLVANNNNNQDYTAAAMNNFVYGFTSSTAIKKFDGSSLGTEGVSLPNSLSGRKACLGADNSIYLYAGADGSTTTAYLTEYDGVSAASLTSGLSWLINPGVGKSAGGSVTTIFGGAGSGSWASNAIVKHNPATTAFTSSGTMSGGSPDSGSHSSAVSAGIADSSVVWIIGGWQNASVTTANAPTSNISKWSNNTDTWTLASAALAAAVYKSSAVTFASKLSIFAGSNAAGTGVNTIQSWNETTRTTDSATLPNSGATASGIMNVNILGMV